MAHTKQNGPNLDYKWSGKDKDHDPVDRGTKREGEMFPLMTTEFETWAKLVSDCLNVIWLEIFGVIGLPKSYNR